MTARTTDRPSPPLLFDRQPRLRVGLLLAYFALPALLVGIGAIADRGPSEVESESVEPVEAASDEPFSLTGSRSVDIGVWTIGVAALGTVIYREAARDKRPQTNELS